MSRELYTADPLSLFTIFVCLFEFLEGGGVSPLNVCEKEGFASHHYPASSERIFLFPCQPGDSRTFHSLHRLFFLDRSPSLFSFSSNVVLLSFHFERELKRAEIAHALRGRFPSIV